MPLRIPLPQPHATLALVLALAGLGLAWSAGARAQQASFDCARATRAAELTICTNAWLRWLDFSLARHYRAAAAAAPDEPARARLRDSQRRWLAERNRVLEDSDDAPDLDYLRQHYINRITALQDLAAAPLMPQRVFPLDDRALAEARPELDPAHAETLYVGAQRMPDGRLVPGARFSPGGELLAISLASAELDFPDQVWLYRLRDGRFIAATPTPSGTHGHGIVQATAWDGPYTLLTRMGDGSVFAASMDGSRALSAPSTRIRDLLDRTEQNGAVEPPAPPGNDHGRTDVRGDASWLAWMDDHGHGTLELKARQRQPQAADVLLQWGSWELQNYRYDTAGARVVYPADNGIVAYELATRRWRRIDTTLPGDLPLAFNARHGLLAWLTHHGCNADDPTHIQRQNLCIAQLPPP